MGWVVAVAVTVGLWIRHGEISRATGPGGVATGADDRTGRHLRGAHRTALDVAHRVARACHRSRSPRGLAPLDGLRDRCGSSPGTSCSRRWATRRAIASRSGRRPATSSRTTRTYSWRGSASCSSSRWASPRFGSRRRTLHRQTVVLHPSLRVPRGRADVRTSVRGRYRLQQRPRGAVWWIGLYARRLRLACSGGAGHRSVRSTRATSSACTRSDAKRPVSSRYTYEVAISTASRRNRDSSSCGDS